MAEQLSGTIGPYRIIRLLGEGGIGAVYEASNDSIERRVAIKVLHPTYACQPEFVGRLFNEARAVNRIDHPGLVQVSDTGKLPDGGAYIVMEYLKGDTLARRTVRHGGGLAPADAVRLSAQIADAVAAAHEKGIIHRDIDPPHLLSGQPN